MNPNCEEVNFSVIREAARRVSAARRKSWALRAELEELREKTLVAEAEVRIIGLCAIALPEDIGAWKQFGPRVEGLADRICQVYDQSVVTALLEKGVPTA
jgi:hypothetical protein